MKNFFLSFKKNYKTSLAGLAVLAVTAYNVSTNPLAILDPTTFTAVTAGVGLLIAKDGDQTGLPVVKVELPELTGKR